MSQDTTMTTADRGVGVWERQLATIFWLELKKILFGSRTTVVYVLAALTVLLFLSIGLVGKQLRLEEVPLLFGKIHQVLLIQLVVYYGCAWIFSNLIRGEILDRSLHYYFLIPVRRELIVAGKYLAGLCSATLVFCAMTLACQIAIYAGQSTQLIINELVTKQLQSQVQYLTMTLLACAGYGALFMMVGLLFKNPFIPAIVFWGWEFINFLLPPVLKQISIIHHLRSIGPANLDQGPFAMLAEPSSPAVAVMGIVLVSAGFLAISAWRLRHLEISYGAD